MTQRLHSDPDIATALASSATVKEAAGKLDMVVTNLEARARSEGLSGLYEACAERGKKRRGPNRRKPVRQLPRWAIFWTPPGAKPVRVWGVDAATEAEALAVAKLVVPEFIDRTQLTAAEVIK